MVYVLDSEIKMFRVEHFFYYLHKNISIYLCHKLIN